MPRTRSARAPVRLAPAVWAGAEAELAAKASVHTPSELAAWGVALVEALDADGWCGSGRQAVRSTM
ncbi:hypothetical protein [Pseudonocardia sp.]|uniref:hypothetical protein n=1 Tax=Pseudonocardia sp. TaxID=60912 RepID=UPI0026226008|nr:hypothetical protein [Pseudonocardia sp.]